MLRSKGSQGEEAFAALMNVKLQDTRVYQEAVEEERKEEARSLILLLSQIVAHLNSPNLEIITGGL